MNMYDNDSHELLCRLVKEFKTKSAVAKALDVSKQGLNCWFNQGIKAPYFQYLKMNKLLDKIRVEEKSRKVKLLMSDFELTEGKSLFMDDLWHFFDDDAVFSISERVRLALIGEKIIGKRQGSRSDIIAKLIKYDENAGQLCKRKNKVSPSLFSRNEKSLYRGRTIRIVSELCGFSNCTTYLQAKAVVQSGQLDLIKAMDNKKISIYQASLKLPRKKSVKTLLSNYGSILLAIYALANKVDYGSKLFLKESLFILDFIIEYCSIAASSCLSVPLTAKPP